LRRACGQFVLITLEYPFPGIIEFDIQFMRDENNESKNIRQFVSYFFFYFRVSFVVAITFFPTASQASSSFRPDKEDLGELFYSPRAWCPVENYIPSSALQSEDLLS
jgi:hypothetical protein